MEKNKDFEEQYDDWLQQRRSAPKIDVTASVMEQLENSIAAPSTDPNLPGSWVWASIRLLGLAVTLFLGFVRLCILLVPFAELQ